MKRVALVTGSGRGIGRTISKTLYESGYIVIINYNQSEKLALNLAQELSKDTLAIKCDISDEKQVKNMIDIVMQKYGRIDILVNNSAVSLDSLFVEKNTETFRKTFNTNVIGTFLVSKYVGQIMYDQKYGKIINLSSTNGINTYFPMCAEYDASKSAINSLTHNLAIQFAPYVNVNAIAPGFIKTESEIKNMDEAFIKSEEEKILVKHSGSEQDVANLVKFLVSDEASFINNQIIKINGGMYGD